MGSIPNWNPPPRDCKTALLPDNPLVYEGLDAIYINSEKALDLEGAAGGRAAGVVERRRASHHRRGIRCGM